MALEFIETLMVSLISGALAGFAAFRIQERKLQKEYQLHDKAEVVLEELLKDERFIMRTFKLIRHHLGGFEDNELRRLLVRAGAIRFKSKNGAEVWGLLERNRDKLSHPRIQNEISLPAGGDDDLFDVKDEERRI